MLTSPVLVSLPAQSQDASGKESPTILDTIFVTGENLNRRLQNTASSVVVLTDKDLNKKPENLDVQEAIQGIPNVNYPGTVGFAPVIRGQDTQGPATGAISFFSGTVPRATISVDGHYQNSSEYVFGSTSIWDVDTVEVFRGPQTTSQGANSIAGAIIVNTKDPTFTPEGAFRAEIGNSNKRRVSAMLSGPLNDQIAARVAIDYFGRDTFIDYINSAYDTGPSDTDIMSVTGRGKLLWEPTEIPGLSAKLTYSLTHNNQPTLEAATVKPYDNLDSVVTNMPSFYTRVNTGIGDISYEFDNGIKVSNQLQYSDSYTQRSINPMTNYSAVIDRQNVTNETLVNFGSQEAAYSGVAGLFYSHTQSDESLSEPRIYGSPNFDDTKENLGIFAETDYRFIDRWTLTTALRYEMDRVKRRGLSTTGSTVDFSYDETFSAFLPKLSLAYDISETLTVGGLISRGFNPGGVVYDFRNNTALGFKEETSWNYELFARGSFLENKLSFSANLFYNDLTNAQRYFIQNVPTVALLVRNAEKAHSYGGELEVSYKALDNLSFSANAGVLKTELDRFSALPGIAGNEFRSAPGYSFGFGVEWGVLENLVLSADVRHTDGYYSDDANSAAYEVDAYTIANARATYQVNDNFQVYGYVDNIFDQRTPTYYQANRSLGVGGADAIMTAPRMFGVGLKATF
ncbi:TonB-dependent receptor [Roseibium algae]|uniref:TonB-dependent receptor n=1 Tax=Roseibium algae TaxID=3123038 RepID=A0ABU8THY0_9HYPH